MVGRTYPLTDQHWQQAIDYSLEKDFISKTNGEMPSQEKILEMRNARYKGAAYQRKEKSTPTKQYKPKVTIPSVINPLVAVESKLDMVQWLNDVKISAYATDILQIPGQK